MGSSCDDEGDRTRKRRGLFLGILSLTAVAAISGNRAAPFRNAKKRNAILRSA